MSLRLAYSAYVVCWPWRLWWLAPNDGHPRGGRCCRCEREVAVPRSATRDGICIYCALDVGLIDGIDAPLCENRSSAGVAR